MAHPKAIEIRRSRFTNGDRRRAAVALAVRKFSHIKGTVYAAEYANMYLQAANGDKIGRHKHQGSDYFDEKFVIELMCELRDTQRQLRRANK